MTNGQPSSSGRNPPAFFSERSTWESCSAPVRSAAVGQTDGSSYLMAAYTYILECSDGSLYTGWTRDLDKRVREHNTSDRGAKYTRSRRPCRLVYYEEYSDKQEAIRREWEIKHRMTRREKLALFGNSGQSAPVPHGH